MINKIKVFFNTIKGFRLHYFVILCLIIISALLESFSAGLITPLVQGIINGNFDINNLFYRINLLIFGKNFTVDKIIIEVLLFLLLSNFLNYIRQVYEQYCEENLKKAWRVKIYTNYINLPYSFFVKKKQGELINNVINETERAAVAINLTIALISSLITSLFFICVLFITSFKLSIIVFSICLTIFYIVKKFLFEYSEKVGKKRIQLSQDLNSQVAETINGILQVKLFNLQNKSIRDFLKTNRILAKLITFYVMFRLIPTYGIKIILCLIGIIILLLNGIFGFLNLKSIIPVVSTFFVVSARLFDVTSNLLTYQMNVINYFPSLMLTNSLLEILEREQLEESFGLCKVDFNKDIIFKNVFFSYDGNTNIFSGLNFVIPANKKIGIVGYSGSGKTTLVYLLTKLYLPNSGTIEFDGVSIKDIDTQYLRSNIGVVTQDNFIFNGTIRDNITMGLENINKEDIIEAAKKANAHNFIMELENGYETLIGEKGLSLSMGQRQRIAIARIILRNPKIFIFDEATNALDKESEELVIDSIDKISKEKTVIIIAHDLDLIYNCDKICFLKDGKVYEQGTHKELLENKRDYWNLYIRTQKKV